MSKLYNDMENFFIAQSELEVVFSLMSDEELLNLNDKIEEMIRINAFQAEGFPLSAGGLGFLQATIMFSFWVRKGKGVKIENGEVVVCELEISPFWKRYHKDKEIEVEIEEEEKHDPDNPDHERDQKEPLEMIDEEVENDKGEWI